MFSVLSSMDQSRWRRYHLIDPSNHGRKFVIDCEYGSFVIRALDYASIASMRTVLIEVTRTDFKGNYEDLEAYIKNVSKTIVSECCYYSNPRFNRLNSRFFFVF